jgi:hypothetical protein
MRKFLFIFLAFCCKASLASPGDGEYAVSSIPGDLLKNSNAVKRKEEVRFEIDNLGRCRLYKKYAITILNENGEKFSSFDETYNKFKEISSIDGNLFNESGKKVRSLKKDEIKDLSATGEESLIEDHRIKYHNFFCKIFPYTIEYECEIKYNTTAYFPVWEPQQGYSYAVQQSMISIKFPSDYAIRYKSFNYQGEPSKEDVKGSKIYSWQVKNMAPIEREYAAPSFYYLTTMVIFGPTQFQMDNYEGDMSTWEGWGKFIWNLRKNRDELPDEIKKEVHQMTDGVQDTRQKIKILYEYLQKNTRYISIQIGIGGWQPYDAKYVAAKKYGDCKALSNYMFALLKEAGISSFYAEIDAGEDEDDIISDFPYPQFNHATLCVPVNKDTIWLECTSDSKPAGYIGGFTGNRQALLITETGSRLVATTKYGLNENLQTRKINGELDGDGNLRFSSQTEMKALQQDHMHERINHYSREKMLEYLKTVIDLSTYDITQFNYREDKKEIPTLFESIDIVAQNYAQVSGKRLFINPNIVNRINRKLDAEEERKYGIELTDEYRDIDSVEIKIPSGYQPESMPQDIKIESKFGKYICSTNVKSDKIIYYRLHEQYSGKFPAADYPELVKYYEQLYKADHSRLVLVKAGQ